MKVTNYEIIWYVQFWLQKRKNTNERVKKREKESGKTKREIDVYGILLNRTDGRQYDSSIK